MSYKLNLNNKFPNLNQTKKGNLAKFKLYKY